MHRSFETAVRLSGIRSTPPDHVTIHTLRHTFGSHLAMAGVPMHVIQKLMGHRNLATTERYAHLSPASITEFVRNVVIAPLQGSLLKPLLTPGAGTAEVGASE